MKNKKGFSITELLVVMAIFSVVMAGLYSAYEVSVRSGVKEYRIAESEMEFQIAKSVIERDIAMAGFGLGDIYCDPPSSDSTCPPFGTSALKCTSLNFCVPVAISAETGTSNSLLLMGTALGRENRATQEWTFVPATSPSVTFHGWSDPTEDLKQYDRIIYIEPNRKSFKIAGEANGATQRTWLFTYPTDETAQEPVPSNAEKGDLVFGMHTKYNTAAENADFPYYIVKYWLGGAPPSVCAKDTKNLLRAETKKYDATGKPNYDGKPLVNCVLDFQVAYGLDTDENGLIDCWDTWGAAAAKDYNNETLRKRFKQVKVFILVQNGDRDLGYTYANPDPDPTYYGKTLIRVGDTLLSKCGGGAVGRDVTLSSDQLNYRWKVVTLSVTPRNLR